MSGRVAAAVLVCTALVGCGTFGPDRRPPSMPSPAHYAVTEPDATLPSADGVAQRLEPALRPVPLWWRAFGSPALDALVDEGLRNSPTLAAAHSTLDAARDGLQAQIGQSLYPSVDVGFDPSRQRALSLPGLKQRTFVYDVFAAEVQTGYTFDFFGAAVLADRSLAQQVRQQALEFAAVRRALATNIVVATIDAASLQEQVRVSESQVDLAEQRAAQAAAQHHLGGASRAEMLAAEAATATAAAALPELRTQAAAVRHAQAVLLGRTPDKAPLPLPLTAFAVPESLPLSIPSELLRQRPDIVAAEAAVRASADAAGAAAASLFPSLTLAASYGRGGFDWSTFTSPAGAMWSVGAALTQPLLHGGALVARKHQYAARYATALSTYRQTVLAAFQNVADTLVALDDDARSLSQTERAREAAGSLAEDTEARYRWGAVSLDAALAAQEQARSAEAHYVRARTTRLNDTAALFQAMGDPPVAGPPTASR